MSVPKNNLAELLKRKASNAHSSSSPYFSSPRPVSDTKKPKFKPAISTTFTNTDCKTTNSLPSFSTPGFRQTVPGQSAPAPRPFNDLEIIYASDVSDPATPNPLKRTSSDPDVMTNPSPQASKRPKKGKQVTDKENTLPGNSKLNPKDYHPSISSRIPGKGATLPVGEDVFPSPQWMANHSDLLELPPENLEHFRSSHYELLKHIMDLLLDSIDSRERMDIKLLQKFRKELSERLEAIKWVEARNQDRQARVKSPCPLSSISNISNEPSTTPLDIIPLTSHARGAQSIVIDVDSNPNTCTSHRTRMTESDDEYWDSVEEISEVAINTGSRAADQLKPRPGFQGPRHDEICRKLKDVFGLTCFRPNQLEAITATMDGKDVFVLMPTGGGKSLCYQLPAVCTTGKTSGVTIVVSPLTALMEDQVDTLVRRGIDAFFWNAESLQHEVHSKLWGGDERPSLLYITPEKLRASSACRNLLGELYRRKQLARFAIDEAHCISTWGQDFRSAYQSLGQLREEYPDVPIIALTATANQRTREDIVDQLRLRDHASFTQSFNRPNLKYIIKNKKQVVDDILDFIKKEHPNHSGVIYCLSRNDCEQLAAQLQQKGIAANFFHAGLSKEDKNRLLKDWKADMFRIIVATIAFGMGIDKADVRFVIHYSMPNSLSNYYQETGRAGRDGKPADCVLYYCFRDFKSICWMIERDRDREEPLTPEGIQRQKDAAREVVKYCANISECRRVQVLRYFGQEFDKRNCRHGCDNCLNKQELVTEDVKMIASKAINIVQTLSNMGDKATLPQLASILRGSNSAEIRKRGFHQIEEFGAAKNVPKELMELVLDRLLVLDSLNITRQKQKSGYFADYVEVGSAVSKAKEVPMYIEWRPPPTKRNAKPTKQTYDRQSKGKQRGDNLNDDPIESFPDDHFSFEQEGPTDAPVGASSTPTRAECSLDSIQELYQKLDKLRHRILVRDGLTSKEAVVSETFLQTLCYSCPQDYVEFRRIMDEAGDDLQSSLNKYHDELLQVCIQHRLGTTRKPSLSTSQLHSRFEYHDI